MIKLKTSGPDIWFTGDTHYGHKNIVHDVSDWEDKSGCRKTSSVEFMNDILVRDINRYVKKDDILFHLGDWSFGGIENVSKFRSRLIVDTIHLILGNHDKHIKTKPELQELFTSVNNYVELVIDGQLIVMSHYPMCSWNEAFKGSWMLHGHCHGTMFKEENDDHWYKRSRILDVGYDSIEVISFEQISKLMHKKAFIQTDHHDKRTSC